MTIIRILFGIGLVVFGSNKLFAWFSPPYQGEGLELIEALQTIGRGYIWKMVAIVELLAGLSFLSNTFVPLMVVVLFPVLLNAVLYHVFADLNLPGLIMAILFFSMNIVLMRANLNVYRDILKR